MKKRLNSEDVGKEALSDKASTSKDPFVSAVNLGIQSVNNLHGLPLEPAFDEIRGKLKSRLEARAP